MHFIKEAISPIICAKLALQLEEAASFWVDRKESHQIPSNSDDQT